MRTQNKLSMQGDAKLHRRLYIARTVYDTWTCHSTQEAGLAERQDCKKLPTADGSRFCFVTL